MWKIFRIIPLAIVFSSCSTVQSNQSNKPEGLLDYGSNSSTEMGAEAEADDIEARIAESNRSLSETDQNYEPDAPLKVPKEINQKVAGWIEYFTERDKERTVRFFHRGSKFKKHIEYILKENGLPKELYYLAMIESGFREHARSHASAVGVWQFIKGTGRNYGLKINNYTDERRNWIKATEAAATYLKDLHNIFGSWYLALAAYNAGEYRIVRSIIRGKTRDFWALAEGGMLPRETLNYVPKFLAAVIIGKNPAKYNIHFNRQETLPEFESVVVPSGVRLRDIARTSNVPLRVLKEWNKDLRRGHTDLDKQTEIYLPKQFAGKIKAESNAIAALKKVRYRKYRSGTYADGSPRNGDFGIYKVKRGDNLSRISQRLGISLRSLMKVNGIRKRHKIHPGQKLKYYRRNYRIAKSSNKSSMRQRHYYTVKRGDTLFAVARKHGVSIQQIKRWNKTYSNRIYIGQKILIRHKEQRRSTASKRRHIHKIRKGESLYAIANKYGTTVHNLKRLNQLDSGKIFAGQSIVVK